MFLMSTNSMLENNLLYLVSADYDYFEKKVYLKFYDTEKQKIILWYDQKNHKPYCYSRENVMQNVRVTNNRGVSSIKIEKKKDIFKNEDIDVYKIITTDPLAIGGTSNSLRNIIKAWEADIKYYANYIIDEKFQIGVPYKQNGNEFIQTEIKLEDNLIQSISNLIEERNSEEQKDLLTWVQLLTSHIPSFKKVAFDLEIDTDEDLRFPMADNPLDPISAISFKGSDNAKIVLLLDINDEMQSDSFDSDFTIEIFKDEKQLIERR